MDEIRLTCTACGVQYRLPADAIPPQGREVQCTACDHVWMARPPGPALAPTVGSDPVAPEDVPADAPRLNRPLSPNVLAILRDELEYERRARETEAEAEAGTPPPAPLPQPTAVAQVPTPPLPSPPPPRQEQAAPDRLAQGPSRGYRMGFGLAAMIAALLLSFYLMAPALKDAGPMGASLAQARADIDDARLRLRAAILGE